MLFIDFYVKYVSNLDNHVQIENQWLYHIILFSVLPQTHHQEALSSWERPLTEITNISYSLPAHFLNSLEVISTIHQFCDLNHLFK